VYRSNSSHLPRPPAQDVTFNRDIAPIIYRNCVPCHRPGESGPFPLLTYADVKDHGRQIVAATRARYMPPWLTEPGYGEFVGERRLTDAEIGLIDRWFQSESPEGDPRDLPPPPKPTEG
jgi:mono/diheme cytochrome c family protein